MKKYSVQTTSFVDQSGQKVFFKGVNLGGSSKVPFTPDGATYKSEGFFNHQSVSFVNRPFPLEEADEHFQRLKTWGFNFLRLIVTWEAIEHAGPGQYDQEYLDYIEAIIRRAGEYGFSIYIDPHQDVWSRFCGGDGAPAWTLEKVGFQLEALNECGAAIIHNLHGDPFPVMVWPTNNTKLAAASMWTLFFAGNDFATGFQIDGENAQDYLQGHYCAAIRRLAEQLNKYDHVIGYGSLNEPSSGWIGWKDLRKNYGLLKMGDMPTPWQSMQLGAGYPQEVEVWKVGKFSLKRTGYQTLNPGQIRAWQPEAECIWKKQGVWTEDDAGNPTLLNPFYFCELNGKTVDFNQDYLKPFINKFSKLIREVDTDAIIFIESEPQISIPLWGAEDADNIVNASHWYDGVTLETKTFRRYFTLDLDTEKLVFGNNKVKGVFYRQLKRMQDESTDRLGGAPTLIGEFGIPFDLNHKNAYKSNDFSNHIQALDTYYQIIESLFLHSTIWNYTSDNSNERGDLWNDEDLSIFSRDQQKNKDDIYSGGRALAAIIRPYCRSLAGEPKAQWFNLARREYFLSFTWAGTAPVDIFVPNFHYPRGFQVAVSDGEWKFEAESQTLYVRPNFTGGEHQIRILPK
jgi:hypothetical protein